MDANDVRSHINYKANIERTLDPVVAQRMLEALDLGQEADYQRLLDDARWPEPGRTVFHSAPTRCREQIESGGLRAARPADSGRWDLMAVTGQATGVYVTDTPDLRGVFSHESTWDIWAIDRADLPLERDPMNSGSWAILSDIEPSRITTHTKDAGHG